MKRKSGKPSIFEITQKDIYAAGSGDLKSVTGLSKLRPKCLISKENLNYNEVPYCKLTLLNLEV